MTPATYETSLRVEYTAGYEEGYRQGVGIISDQRAALYSDIEASLREALRVSARPFSRAYAAGMLRGFRHAAWSVR